MPIVKNLDAGLWEIRSKIKNGIARIIFTIREDTIILLHGFIKKSDKIPQDELNTAKQRKKSF
jgi:phage-related protein